MTTNPANTPVRTGRAAAAALLALAAALGTPGCRGERSDSPPRQFIPDMDDNPKFRPQAQTSFFKDQRAMRPRVPGTVAFGYTMNAKDPARVDRLREEPGVYEGVDPTRPPAQDGRPAYQPYIPDAAIAIFAQRSGLDPTLGRDQVLGRMIERGQERFNITCALCHGYQGDGKGPVGVRWTSPVPSFHAPQYQDRSVYTGQDGYIFHTILHGVPNPAGGPPRMPAYADKVSVSDAWAIVAYVRVLQASRVESLDQVPAELRPDLERTRPPIPAAPSEGAPPPAIQQPGPATRAPGGPEAPVQTAANTPSTEVKP